MTSHTMVVVTISCLLTFVVITSRPVSLVIVRYSTPGYLLHLNFYNDTLQQFYTCMTQTTSSKCFLNFKYDQQHPYKPDDIYVDTITEQGVISPSDLDYFSCRHEPQISKVICERHTGNSGDWNGYQSFRLCGLSSGTQCARLLPSALGEKLLYNSATDHIQECSTSCTQTTTSTTSLTSRLVTVLSSAPTEPSTASDDVSSANDNKDKTDKQPDNNNNNLPVILGAVCGVLVVVIVIIIGFFIWRRHRLKANKCREGHDHVVSSVGSYGNDRNGYRNTQQSDKVSSNLSKTPGSTSSLSRTESRNRQTADSANGNYILKHDCSAFTYYNTLDGCSQPVNDVTSTKEQTTPDDDYENSGDRDYRNIDTVVAGADDGYVMIDDYNLAQTTDTISHQ